MNVRPIIGVSSPSELEVKRITALKEKGPVVHGIEKNIPLREYVRGRTRGTPYPFREMEVGDSFRVSCHPDDLKKLAGRVANAARTYGQKNAGFAYAVRSGPDHVRCWRIKPPERETGE